MAFRPDGAQLATGSLDNTAKLWSPQSGALQATLEGHRGSIFDIRYSRDGRWILSGSTDGTARLWEAESGRLLFSMGSPEHSGGTVKSVAFDASGEHVLTAGQYDGIVLRDVAPESRSAREVAQIVSCRIALALAQGRLRAVPEPPPGCPLCLRSGPLDRYSQVAGAETLLTAGVLALQTADKARAQRMLRMARERFDALHDSSGAARAQIVLYHLARVVGGADLPPSLQETPVRTLLGALGPPPAICASLLQIGRWVHEDLSDPALALEVLSQIMDRCPGDPLLLGLKVELLFVSHQFDQLATVLPAALQAQKEPWGRLGLLIVGWSAAHLQGQPGERTAWGQQLSKEYEERVPGRHWSLLQAHLLLKAVRSMPEPKPARERVAKLFTVMQSNLLSKEERMRELVNILAIP